LATPATATKAIPRKSSGAAQSDPCEAVDSIEAAKLVGLRYVTDQSPGIRRRKTRAGFRYIDPDGNLVRSATVLDRINALAIPPAWTDVWICRWSNGHLQATGRDDRGRKQYRYHSQWRAMRDETKYGRMAEFGRALPSIRRRVDADLARHGLPREKVLAAVVRLLELTLIRVGNEEYARTNESFGLTTMRDDHVNVSTTGIRFTFRGKSGKEHDVGLQDRRLASIVARCRDLPGQDLFQYIDADGNQHAIESADVNAYLREVSGAEFTAKDFRTWYGTVLAMRELLTCERGETEQERKHQIVSAIDAVAGRLGNTPAICRKCYVHPVVLEAFASGELTNYATRQAPDELKTERILLKLLETVGPAA
jgi:DNA topoisomerase-1